MGLAARVWEGDHWERDHKDLYPTAVAGTNGGTIDFITGLNAWRHFQVMSNELSTPYIMICAAESDPNRTRATNFNFMSNSNLSYFVGVDADETNPQMILFRRSQRHQRNAREKRLAWISPQKTPPAGPPKCTTELATSPWADGSVQQVSNSGLRYAVTNTSLATNRLQMPVLTP